MIGVICKSDQLGVVEELFELFKTPWELFECGREYDVVIATTDELPEVDAKLLLVYGSGKKNIDARYGVTVHSRTSGGTLTFAEGILPIYGNLANFKLEAEGDSRSDTMPSTVGRRVTSTGAGSIVRFGYDLFEEARLLLSTGQPAALAHIPTLDLHIDILRRWILNEGISLVEIPPTPAGYNFTVCLTHDIDFIGIREHKFDHTMWGFLYRATIGSVQKLFRGRISFGRLIQNWRAAASLPFVYLGWVRDFWSPFEWYLRVEKDIPATYFLIPFKRRNGENVKSRHASRRAAAYDVGDLREWVTKLKKQGCEIGVHGIDAWHDAEKGRAEMARVAEVSGEPVHGVRMHWLLNDGSTVSVLERSGYEYDSTAGYNETIGFRNGTAQVFHPNGVKTLLELPLHIQDGALFYGNNLDLSDSAAEKLCQGLIADVQASGGVLTVLWHDRSHAPERFWGDFYERLVQTLKSSNVWFATSAQTVSWSRQRRTAKFSRISSASGVRTSVTCKPSENLPHLRVRVHSPVRATAESQSCGPADLTYTDFAWNGENSVEFDSLAGRISEVSAGSPVVGIC